MQRRFPMIDFAGIERRPVRAEIRRADGPASVQTLVDRFVRAGGEYSRGAALPVSAGKAESKLRRGRASPAIASCSRWAVATEVLPASARQEDLRDPAGGFLLRHASGGSPLPSRRMPGWADFNAGDIFYGFPDLENRGVKFAHDKHGRGSTPTRRTAARTRPRSTKSSPSATGASLRCGAPRLSARSLPV